MPMPARLRAAVSLGAALLLLGACDAVQPEQALAPDAVQPPDPALASGGVRIVPGPATGAQEISTVLGSFAGGVLLTVDTVVGVKNYYTFDALRSRKGTATGSFRFVSAYENVAVVLSGTVVCYTVQGNRARIGGIVTFSSFPEIPVGTAETWSVADNGEVDEGSSLLGGDAAYAQAYCANGLPYPEQPYLSGGVRIVP